MSASLLAFIRGDKGILERSFVEDESLENGNYECKCTTCGKTFSGHKRRITCKLCEVKKDEQ